MKRKRAFFFFFFHVAGILGPWLIYQESLAAAPPAQPLREGRIVRTRESAISWRVGLVKRFVNNVHESRDSSSGRFHLWRLRLIMAEEKDEDVKRRLFILIEAGFLVSDDRSMN